MLTFCPFNRANPGNPLGMEDTLASEENTGFEHASREGKKGRGFRGRVGGGYLLLVGNSSRYECARIFVTLTRSFMRTCSSIPWMLLSCRVAPSTATGMPRLVTTAISVDP